MLPSTIAINEAIWTLSGLPGFIVWSLNLRNMIRTFGSVRKQDSEIGLLLGGVLFRLGLAGTLASLGIAFIGAFAMTQPQVVQRITPTGWVVTGVLMLIGLLVTAMGIDIKYTTERVWHLARRAVEDETAPGPV